MPENLYFKSERREMLKFLPRDTKRLLEVGCAEGVFGSVIKGHLPGCEVWGVEPTDAAAIASQRLDKVYNAPFTKDLDLPRDYFDVVTMTDVLEHIVDTDAALQLAKETLKPGGLLVLSLPNVQFYVHVYRLIRDNNWDYMDDGILDRTHVRFFTTSSIQKTLEHNGFDVELVEGLPGLKPSRKWKLAFALFPKTLYWSRFFQFAVVARRPETGDHDGRS